MHQPAAVPVRAVLLVAVVSGVAGFVAGILLTGAGPSTGACLWSTKAALALGRGAGGGGGEDSGAAHAEPSPAAGGQVEQQHAPAAGSPTSVASALAALTERPAPLYVPAPASELRRIGRSGLSPASNRVAPPGQHSYSSLYSTLLDHRRHEALRLLELGLGCGAAGRRPPHGAGAGVALWRKYLPRGVVWVAEKNVSCSLELNTVLEGLRVHSLVGDQSDASTLQFWVKVSGGGFDVIVDAGGHQNHEVFTAFQALFATALKPGGAYVIEGLQASRRPELRGPEGSPVMMDVVRDYIESLLAPKWRAGRLEELKEAAPAPPGRHALPPGVKQIVCGPEACAILKCAGDDDECPTGGGDFGGS